MDDLPDQIDLGSDRPFEVRSSAINPKKALGARVPDWIRESACRTVDLPGAPLAEAAAERGCFGPGRLRA